MNHSTATKAQQEKTAGQFKRPGSEALHRLTSPNPYADMEALQHHAGNRAVHDLLQGKVPQMVQSVISSGGQPLEPALRTQMESRFGQDFSQVRVHTDGRAAESAEAINANAYTVADDVVFGRNQYAPHSAEGKRLLAHELAHVVQQGRGGAVPVLGADTPHEAAAGLAADAVVGGTSSVEVGGATGVGVAREERKNADLFAEFRHPRYLRMGSVVKNDQGKIIGLSPVSPVERNRSPNLMLTQQDIDPREQQHRAAEESKTLAIQLGIMPGIAPPLVPKPKPTTFDWAVDQATQQDIDPREQQHRAAEESKTLAIQLGIMPGIAPPLVPKPKPTTFDWAVDQAGKLPLEIVKRVKRNIKYHPVGQLYFMAKGLADLPESYRRLRDVYEKKGGVQVAREIFVEPVYREMDEMDRAMQRQDYVGAASHLANAVEHTADTAEMATTVVGSVQTATKIPGLVRGAAASMPRLARKARTLAAITMMSVEETGAFRPISGGPTWTTGAPAPQAVRILGKTGEKVVEHGGKRLLTGAGKEVLKKAGKTELKQAGQKGVEELGKAGLKGAAEAGGKKVAELSGKEAVEIGAEQVSKVPAPVVVEKVLEKAGKSLPENQVKELRNESPLEHQHEPPAKPDVGLADQGYRPAPGERVESKEAYKKRRGAERWAEAVEKAFAGDITDTAEVPGVKGGASNPRIDNKAVPSEPRARLDMDSVPRLPGETQPQAVQRVKTVIGKNIADHPVLEHLWNNARASVTKKNALSQSNYEDLYNRTRQAFWRRVRSNPQAVKILTDAGFGFGGGKTSAPVLNGVGGGIPVEELRISLDHTKEKAQGDNWKKALDADNLRFEFSQPNTEREIKQMRHPELR